jgi:ABC-2 type transport system permease protein
VRGGADTWIIFSEELRGHLRSRWYLIFTAAVVVLLIIAMIVVPLFQDNGSPAAPQEDLSRIGYSDDSGLFGTLGGSAGPVKFDSRTAGLQAVAGGQVDSFYVIAADYLQTGRVEQYADFEGRFPSSPAGQGAFQTLLVQTLIAGKVDAGVAARVLDPTELESFRVNSNASVSDLTPAAEAAGELLVPTLFAALLGMGLAVGFGYMVASVAEDKESRLVEVVITSTSPWSIVAGRLLALLVVGLAQAAIWVIAAALTMPRIFNSFASGGDFTVSAGTWGVIVVAFVTGYLLTTALSIFIGAVAPSSREAGRLGGWIPVLGFAPFWFYGLLISQPDGVVARILSYFPLVAPTGVLLRSAAGGQMAAWQIVAALAGVAVTAAVILWLAARVFRAGILMRGQNFTGHNVWAALRDPD